MPNDRNVSHQQANNDSVANAEHTAANAFSLKPPAYSIDGQSPPDESTFFSQLEEKFQTDFSDIAIVTDSEEAAELGVKAFTQGNTIYFRSGEYNPGTPEGQEVIAHELTHVIQGQNNKVDHNEDLTEEPISVDPEIENEASAVGRRVANGGSAPASLQPSKSSNNDSTAIAHFCGMLEDST